MEVGNHNLNPSASVPAPRNEAPSWWEGRDALNFRYLDTNFPCRAACPVHTNAGGYVSLIAQGKYGCPLFFCEGFRDARIFMDARHTYLMNKLHFALADES